MNGMFPEFLFAGFFLVFMCGNFIVVFLSEKQSLQLVDAISCLSNKLIRRPPHAKRTASQPGLTISIHRQPVVRGLP